MEKSLIAKERYIESQIYNGEYLQDDLSKGFIELRSHVRKMNDREVIQFIKGLGVDIDKETFIEEAKSFYSVEKYCRYLVQKNKISIDDVQWRSLWRRLSVLWERWMPEVPNFEKIDDMIYLGYGFIQMHHSERVIDMWLSAWRDIKVIMKRHKFKDVNIFNEKYRGSEDLIAWGSDFEGEAFNAGMKNEEYFFSRIDFCIEFLNRNKEMKEITRENMQRAIAESLFCLGNRDEGEAMFEKYLSEDPTWGWGWIGWSDCYWMIGKDKNKDYKRAEKILLKALQVAGLRDYEDVYERLIRVRFKIGEKDKNKQ